MVFFISRLPRHLGTQKVRTQRALHRGTAKRLSRRHAKPRPMGALPVGIDIRIIDRTLVWALRGLGRIGFGSEYLPALICLPGRKAKLFRNFLSPTEPAPSGEQGHEADPARADPFYPRSEKPKAGRARTGFPVRSTPNRTTTDPPSAGSAPVAEQRPAPTNPCRLPSCGAHSPRETNHTDETATTANNARGPGKNLRHPQTHQHPG